MAIGLRSGGIGEALNEFDHDVAAASAHGARRFFATMDLGHRANGADDVADIQALVAKLDRVQLLMMFDRSILA